MSACGDKLSSSNSCIYLKADIEFRVAGWTAQPEQSLLASALPFVLTRLIKLKGSGCRTNNTQRHCPISRLCQGQQYLFLAFFHFQFTEKSLQSLD